MLKIAGFLMISHVSLLWEMEQREVECPLSEWCWAQNNNYRELYTAEINMLCYKQYLTHCATSQNHGEIANGLFRLWFQSRCMQDLFAPSQTMVGPSVAPNMPDAISIGRAGPKCGCKVGAPLGRGGGGLGFLWAIKHEDYWGLGWFVVEILGTLVQIDMRKKSSKWEDYSGWDLGRKEFVRLSHMIILKDDWGWWWRR